MTSANGSASTCATKWIYTTHFHRLFQGRKDRVLADSQDSGGIPHAPTFHGQIDDLILNARFVRSIGIADLKSSATLIAATPGMTALGAVPHYVCAVAIFAAHGLTEHFNSSLAFDHT
jgi:hypothetical protein